ncbi:hypothetical protein RB595_001918 [Gaeumannomyces hyphopodioides]
MSDARFFKTSFTTSWGQPAAASSASASGAAGVPSTKGPHSPKEDVLHDINEDGNDNDVADLMAYLGVASSIRCAILDLRMSDLKPIISNYCLGFGRSSVLQRYVVSDREMESLKRQGWGQRQESQGSDFARNYRHVEPTVDSKTGQWAVALKTRVSFEPDGDKEAFRAFKQELRVLDHPNLRNHPSIAKLLFIGFGIDGAPAVGLRLAEFGTMRDVLQSRRLGPELACEMTLDIIDGVCALHASGIAHGDIKPDNILVLRHDSRVAVAQLSDFSDAVFVSEIVDWWQPVGGTHEWRAPECYDYEEAKGRRQRAAARYDAFKSDIYSLGLCAHSILVPGQRHAPGLPGHVFLHRENVGNGYDGQESRKMVTEIKRSSTGIIGRAQTWSDTHGSSAPMTHISTTMASWCLHRDPNKRLVAAAVMSGFYMRAKVFRLVKAESWAARQLQHEISMKQQIEELDDEADLGSHETYIHDGTLSSLPDLMASFNMMSMGHARLSQNVVMFGPAMLRELESCLAEASSSFREQELLPVPDDAFLDGDFTLTQLREALAGSVTVNGVHGPMSAPFKANKGLNRAILAARELMFFKMHRGRDMVGDLPMLVRLTGKLARLGDQSSMKYHLLLSAWSGVKLTDKHETPLKLWMAFASLNGFKCAQDFLEREDRQLLDKLQTMADPKRRDPERAALIAGMGPRPVFPPRPPVERSGTTLSGTTQCFNELHLAILDHDLSSVVNLVRKGGVYLDQWCVTTSYDGNDEIKTPIMLAAWKEDLDIFEFLLRFHVNLTQLTNYAAGVLHFITRFPDEQAARLAPELVHRGASLTTPADRSSRRDDWGVSRYDTIHGTPLRWAVQIGHRHLTRCLVNLHKEHRQPVRDLNKILSLAAEQFSHEELAILLSEFQNLDRTGAAVPAATLEALLKMVVSGWPRGYDCYIRHGPGAFDLQIKTIDCLLRFDTHPGGCNSAGDGSRSIISPRIWTAVVLSNSLPAFEHLIHVSLSLFQEFSIDTLLNDKTLFDEDEAAIFAVRTDSQAIFNYLIALVDEGALTLSLAPGPFLDCRPLLIATKQYSSTSYLAELVRRDAGGRQERWVRGRKELESAVESAIVAKNYRAARFLLGLAVPDDEGRADNALLALMKCMANYPGSFGRRDIDAVMELGPDFGFYIYPGRSMTLLHYFPHMREERASADVIHIDHILLDRLLRVMPADVINRRCDDGHAALHYMVWAGDADAVFAMLQCEKVDAAVPVGPGGEKAEAWHFPEGSTCFDVFLVQCGQRGIPKEVRGGGAREIHLYLERMGDMLKLLDQHQVPSSRASDGGERRAHGERALRALSAVIEKETSNFEDDEEGTQWPMLIPRQPAPQISAPHVVITGGGPKLPDYRDRTFD